MPPFLLAFLVLFATLSQLPIATYAQQCTWSLADDFQRNRSSNPGGSPIQCLRSSVWHFLSASINNSTAFALPKWTDEFASVAALGAWEGTEPQYSYPRVLKNFDDTRAAMYKSGVNFMYAC